MQAAAMRRAGGSTGRVRGGEWAGGVVLCVQMPWDEWTDRLVAGPDSCKKRDVPELGEGGL